MRARVNRDQGFESGPQSYCSVILNIMKIGDLPCAAGTRKTITAVAAITVAGDIKPNHDIYVVMCG